MRSRRFSLTSLSIKHRLPLLIGSLLLGIILATTWASYRGVKESALEVGGERLQNLTKQLASLLQQSTALRLTRTITAANDPAIRAFLQSPSPGTRSAASVMLEQFAAPQDPQGLQVELWDSKRSLVLTVPNGASPVPVDLAAEFKAGSVDPFKTVGPITEVNDIIAVPAVVAVQDDMGKPIGYLVSWRRTSLNPQPKQLTDLLGSEAALYFGNIRGDLLTDLARIVSKPQAGLGSSLEVMHYSRDGKRVMGLGRPISGTPWFVAIEFPEQPLLAPARQFLRRILLVDLVVFIVGMAGAIVLSRGITRPLQVLTEAASAIGSGDYSRTVDLQKNDELGALANAFNLMAVTTRDSQLELERRVEERTLQLESAPCAMLMVNAEGLVTLVNAQTELLFGYDRAELLEKPIEMLLPLRYRAAHPGHRRIFGEHPSARAMGAGRELYGLRKDGSEIPVEIGLNPITTDKGEFILASIIDITARKRAEERFRLVVEASPSATLMVSEAGLMTLVNKQTEELFGYSRNELLAQPIEMLVPERYRAAHPDHRTGFFRKPSTRAMGAGRDLYGLRKDGSEVPIEIGLNPVHTDEGSFVLASIIDITERKRADERFRQLIEHAPNGMVMVDQKGTITLVNAQIEKSFGYSRDELLGQPMELLVPKRFQTSHITNRNSFIANPSARVMGAGRDLYGSRKDGTEFPVEIGLNPLETEQGTMVLGTIVDITERKQVEETLRRSQEQLAGVIGSAMDAIISVDEDQRVVLFNTAAERMFLFPAEDAIGQRLDRFIPERFRATHKRHVQDFGKTHVTRRSMGTLGALYGVRADGEEFPIEASISQIESDSRKIYTVILRDITERKRAEEVLKEQGRILDLAPVLIRDLSGRISFWNSGSERMYGWTREEALESLSHNLLKTEFPRPVEEIKARLFARGHWEGELVHTRRDGERIVVASHWVLHKNELDEPKAILEVNNDITERKEAEKEIRRLNQELEQRVADRTAQLEAANKELEAFSYSVSHDLRAPLRHINGFSQALLEDYEDKLDDDGKKYLQEVRNASQEMAQLIDDVLQLARVTRSEMRREQVNLTELARTVVADLQKTDVGRDIKVTIEDELISRGDKRLLRIVLTNLLGNAWKFTLKQNRPEITFGSQRKNGEAFYFVHDNGAGFDMAYVNKLFGAFQRLHGSDQFEGTGIGLATVQRIITRHGGRVWAEGALNKGATFFFTLLNSKERGNVQESDSTS